MALDHPVQNSEVYILSTHPPSNPPCPPSPITPYDRALSPPPDALLSIEPPQSRCATFNQRLANAVHVLTTEATALSCLTRLYETDPIAREGFDAAVEAISRFKGDRGKLVISGVGKSGHIAKKLVATMNSLAIHATYLHPTEALHGDLGKVGRHDTILLITFSGKTPELLALLPHFDRALPLIVMTSHISPSTCEIIRRRPDTILLPAPIHESETLSFGVSAPTTSTTMALALGDALAVAISDELHPSVAAVFSQNHPGGAIGQQVARKSQKLSSLVVPLSSLPDIAPDVTAAHVLLAAYRSSSGWVRVSTDRVIAPTRIGHLAPRDMDTAARDLAGLIVPRADWIEVSAETELGQAREWIQRMREKLDGGLDEELVVAATAEDGAVVGVLELGGLFS